MQTSRPTGTVTFLFTDIEGSTRLWEASSAAMRPALARHDELLRSAIENNGGYVFKTVGDAFCATFNTAPEAVAAALEAQLALSAEAWAVAPPVRARMALHTGATEERDGDYYGQTVNRVARLLSAGHGGQTLVSLVTQELIRDALPEFTILVDLGDASLKDLNRPERVYQLQHAQLPSEFPPLKALNSPELPNNLPQQPTSFIGRENELADVKALLLKSHLLTLVGAGGAGKTRLALQAAADLLDGGGDGVWLVELAPITNPALVPSAVAQALGVKEAAGQPIEKTLRDALKTKTLLIVLDNCEHLIQACADLAADLLRNCSGVHILATSREPLGVPGEQIFRIPSLSVPAYSGGNAGGASGDTGARSSPTAQSLSQYDSVLLFVERAKAVQPSFAVTDANAPSVAQLCYHLDGIPLAIELAAARVRSMPVEQVNARLDSRFRLLTGGARTLLPRQQTLKALIDWSYDLLADQEKALLARLSVFAGGWTLDAAEAICSGDPIEDWETLDLLTSLTDKSLVVYEENLDEGGAARYRLLESMRQYGQERLSESGGSDEFRRRHRDWFLQFARNTQPELSRTDASLWLKRLEADHDNLRAALLWCEQEQPASKLMSSGDAESQSKLTAGLHLSAALAGFWFRRSYYFEGRYWFNKMLPLREESDAAQLSPDDLLLLARALSGAGVLAYSQGDFPAATELHQESLRLRRKLGNSPDIANVINSLGNVAFAQGDYGAARARYEESLVIRRDTNDKSGIAAALGNLGLVAVNLCEYDTAEPLLYEGLSLMRELGDRQGVAVSLNNLGNLLCARDDRQGAQRLFQESLDLSREIGDQRRIANALTNLAAGWMHQGDYAAAAASFLEGLEIRRRAGDQAGVAQSLKSMAELADMQKRHNRACTLWSAAATLREHLGSSLTAEEQHDEGRLLNLTRDALGQDTFNIALAAGRAMTWQQAADYALTSDD